MARKRRLAGSKRPWGQRIPKGETVLVSDTAHHLHKHVMKQDKFYTRDDVVTHSDEFVFGCTAAKGWSGFQPVMTVTHLRVIDYTTIATGDPNWPYIVFCNIGFGE